MGNDDLLAFGRNLVIEAGDSITITTGSASISMKRDGTVEISGTDIVVQGSGGIVIKSGGDLVLQGARVLQN